MMKIVEMTRGRIVVQIDQKTIDVGAEMLMPVQGEPDYLIYADSIVNYNRPFAGLPVEADIKPAVLQFVYDELVKANLVPEIV